MTAKLDYAIPFEDFDFDNGLLGSAFSFEFLGLDTGAGRTLYSPTTTTKYNQNENKMN